MNPKDLLYIYELEGELTLPETWRKEDFVAHWREEDSHFLFFSRAQEDLVKDFVQKHPEINWVRSHTITYKDWQGGESLETLSIGNFIFVPPRVPLPEEHKGILLRLDSGVVFGSGTHPTTRDSLQALQWVYDQDRPRNVLDLGSGTGILSLAAVSLGAEEVLAVDMNPACVRTTEKNAQLNNLSHRIKVLEGRAEDYIRGPADLVLANLHFAVIRELIETKTILQKKWVVLSGLLRSEFQEVKHRLQVPEFRIFKEWDSEFTWFTLVGGFREFFEKSI
ncbi:MAG: 50S ribosomal protein L11 methyltransferase [Thermodesulfobacteriota bacterium]